MNVLPRRYHRIKQVLEKRQPDLTVLTEDVHKPHNLSAIIRTCDAVGILDVHTINSTDEFPTFSQVSQGSDKWIFLHTHPNIETAITYLKSKNFKIYAAHFTEESLDYREIDYTQPTTILLGAEKWGVSEKAANLVDDTLSFPC